MKKSWWNENLTLLWNDVCKAERAWHKCHSGCKKDLRHIFVEKRKLFDKSSQKAKRQFWYHSQEQLLDDQRRDPREFWKKIGKVGVGNERQKSIPMEVTLDDGTTNREILFEEVVNAIAKSKNGKSPGIDQLSVELFKNICIDVNFA
ncbi:Hypothetical predicted protein [Mytilus galloprovincialis]|uniref:Uncharacterized protein n=1 Tax=Mytilus galloprovincialis TaxID=29158 RepID=A0A8B6EME6_MYTGA|nr:Hypothetical predicted protein [Mytilus galloprovincialis]